MNKRKLQLLLCSGGRARLRPSRGRRANKEGQAYVYHPVVNRSQAQKKAVKHILSRFFNNSPELLVMNLLETDQMDPEDLERIQRLINQGEEP